MLHKNVSKSETNRSIKRKKKSLVVFDYCYVLKVRKTLKEVIFFPDLLNEKHFRFKLQKNDTELNEKICCVTWQWDSYTD